MRRVILTTTMCCLVVGFLISSGLNRTSVATATNPFPYSSAVLGRNEPAKTLCERNEQVVFSCVMQKSAKVISICTSKQLGEQSGYVQYRFGQPGKIELEFPADRKNSQSAFTYNRYTRPLVTYLTLGFESNGYKYSVHQDSNAEEKPAANSSYLNVTPPEPDAKTIEMTCRQPVTGSLMLLEDVVPKNNGNGVAAR